MKTIEERIAEICCTLVLIFATGYFGGHVIAAWINGVFQAALHGAFQQVTR